MKPTLVWWLHYFWNTAALQRCSGSSLALTVSSPTARVSACDRAPELEASVCSTEVGIRFIASMMEKQRMKSHVTRVLASFGAACTVVYVSTHVFEMRSETPEVRPRQMCSAEDCDRDFEDFVEKQISFI